MNNKQGKYRIAYIVIAGIIFFLILIMTFAPDSQQITGNSIAENQITGKIAAKSIFAVSTTPKSARGMLGITGMVTGAQNEITGMSGASSDQPESDYFTNNPAAFTWEGVICVRASDNAVICNNGIAFSRNAENNGWVTTQSGGIVGQTTFLDTDPFGQRAERTLIYLPSSLANELPLNVDSSFGPERIIGTSTVNYLVRDGNTIAYYVARGSDIVYNTFGDPVGRLETNAIGTRRIIFLEQSVLETIPRIEGTTIDPQQSTSQQPPNEDQTIIDNFIRDKLDSQFTFDVTSGTLVSQSGSVLTRDSQVYTFIEGVGLVTQAQRTGGLLTVLEGNRYVVAIVDKETGQITGTKPLTQPLTPDQLQQIRTETQSLTRAREQIRQAHRTKAEREDLNRQYNMISQQFTGWLAGVLSNELDKVLGSWSRGVPGKICQAAYGLEYDRPSGWIRVEPNASVYEAGQQLISHARTAIISGEKEEITSTLLRYAYSLRLLGDTSVAWETYLKNSCTERDSKEQFYDQGALGPGDYFYMHYAGSEGNDMIFNCETEECIYDQACVKFADEQDPYCVDLVNGVGFITVPSNAYGCG